MHACFGCQITPLSLSGSRTEDALSIKGLLGSLLFLHSPHHPLHKGPLSFLLTARATVTLVQYSNVSFALQPLFADSGVWRKAFPEASHLHFCGRLPLTVQQTGGCKRIFNTIRTATPGSAAWPPSKHNAKIRARFVYGEVFAGRGIGSRIGGWCSGSTPTQPNPLPSLTFTPFL